MEENTRTTLMLSRAWDTTIIVYAIHRPKQRRRRAHAHHAAVPAVETQALGYVMVIVWVEASHCTSAPKLSATKRRGSIVRLFRI